ncbi:Pentatricopeptide repeat [Macleaya cordata]|uniref:Pentatricopeptide repeat n=1 Tax=Macleaya cordata TaxID=56857 RepID=A0A200QE91_MACCD|nr:Pentatricopeptide repeat [Macleaya cordata]
MSNKKACISTLSHYNSNYNPILRLLQEPPPPSFGSSCNNNQKNLIKNLITDDLRKLHAYSITTGLIREAFTASRIIQLCFKFKIKTTTTSPQQRHYGRIIFGSIDCPDVYTWNSTIIGLAEQESPESGISHYFQMLQRGVPPDSYTFAFLIKVCIIMLSRRPCNQYKADELVCREIHGQVLKHGFEELLVIRNSLINMYCNMGCLSESRVLFETSSVLDLISWNSMISGYGKHRDVSAARELFDEMPERNLVSWSAIIDGYVRSGGFSEALSLFNQMQGSGIKPDVIILVSVLKACANLGALDLGRWVHMYIDKSKLLGRERSRNLVLETALVDMYAKCGCIIVALELFNEMPDKDVILWNAMIGGLAMHGHGRDALHLFSRMMSYGTIPNDTTFVTVLSACAHAGMVTEGVDIFQSMKQKYRLEPKVEHYGCFADLLGRAGLVTEAEKVLENMPMKPQASQLGALMAACRTHNNIEVGERVGNRLISLEPHDGGRYVLLSNMYAAAGRWEDARNIRKQMEQNGAKKETGCSFMESDGVVHEFVVGDTRHHQSREIYAMLGDIERELKGVGFVQDASNQVIDF